MKHTELWEMAFLSGIGAGIGVVLADALGWPLWTAMIACALLVGACYQPLQIVDTVRTEVPPLLTRESVCTFAETAFVVVSWIGWCLTTSVFAMIIPATIMFTAMTHCGETWARIDMTYLVIFMSLMTGLCFFMYGTLFGAAVRKMQQQPDPGKDPMWSMPLSRRLHRLLVPRNRWYSKPWNTSLAERVWCVTGKVIVAQVWGTVFLSLLAIDIVLTIGMAAATTKRIAVMSGAAIGCLVGTVAGWMGWCVPPTGIFVGMAVGGCIGYFWFPVSEFLRTPTWEVEPGTELACS